MDLRSLRLRNFRLYTDERIDFGPGINILHGPNATGKTTILEAIYLFLCGRSFRPSQPLDWIQHGREQLSLELHFAKHGIEQQLRIVQSAKERDLFHNQTAIDSISSLLGIIQGVIMTPDDVALVKGAPQVRRHFLDLQIAQVDPLYVHYLTRYQRAMRQRNVLLKQKRIDSIESWESEMAVAAAYIIPKRCSTVADLHARAQKWYEMLSSSNEIFMLGYRTGVKNGSDPVQVKEEMIEKYRRLRPRELEIGFSLAGPHKDDLEMILQNKEAKFFGSEGQQRTCLAALRLAEWEGMSAIADNLPLMMIDDAGLGLDEKRKRQLFQSLEQMGQVFLTSTEMPSMKFNKQVHVISKF